MKTKLSETLPLSGTQYQEAPSLIDSSGQERILGILKSENPTRGLGIIPEIIAPLTENKISVLVQHDTGEYLHITDIDYADRGAEIYDDTAAITGAAHVIIKTSPISINELQQMRTGQILLAPFVYDEFTMAHHEQITQKKITAIAYNFIKDRNGNTMFDLVADDKFPDEMTRQKTFADFILPLILNLIFNKDIRVAIQTCPEILQGTCYYQGILSNKGIADKFSLDYKDILELCWNWN